MPQKESKIGLEIDDAKKKLDELFAKKEELEEKMKATKPNSPYILPDSEYGKLMTQYENVNVNIARIRDWIVSAFQSR